MDGILTSFRECRRMMAFPDHHYHFYYFVKTASADFASAGYKFESPADAGLSNCSIGAEAPAAAFGKTASADFASAGYKFENPADAGLSNCSIGAEAPAAAFGKTASADFASARYKYGTQSFVP